MIHQLLAATASYGFSAETSSEGISPVFLGIYLALVVFIFICVAKIFMKAGRAWWAAFVPIYSTIVLLRIIGRPIWWFLLLVLPFVGIIFAIIVFIDLSKSFGKGVGTGILLLLFPYIMYPIMAFSKDYQYVGPAAGKDDGPVGPVGPTAPVAPIPLAAPTPSSPYSNPGQPTV